ncbi:MAG TPA: cytochrome D ubiquinol oxidase subunit II [Paenibacillaceae bacterium]|nr:cytochrome D ubiquinol oxidase subunit II [Paenibacillaceae bacterium]
MTYELLGVILLWTFLYGYVIIASIDFGAGFFLFYGKWRKKDHIINRTIERYMSPVWEITNVLLVFFFIGLVGFYPEIAYYYGTALLIPGSIALILLAIRGGIYAFSLYGKKDNFISLFLYGATGLLIPAALSTVLTISEGGYIYENQSGIVVFSPVELITSPYSWAVVFLAIVSVLFISASFLTFYANRARDYKAMELLRQFALLWSAPTIVASVLIFATIQIHNDWHFKNMIHYSWMFILSLVCFGIAVYLINKKEKLGLAFIMVMLQFGFAFYGYGASHLPYLLYPYIMLDSSNVNPQMGLALVISFIAGLVLVVPSLYLLLKMFLFNLNSVKGR